MMSADQWTAVLTGMTAAFTGVLAVTGVWALVYARKQLRQSRESEKVQHLLRFVEQFDNAPLANSRKSLAEKRLKGLNDTAGLPPELHVLLNFFEMIGLLVIRDYLDVHDVWSAFSYWVLFLFADFRQSLEEQQREEPTFYSDFLHLVQQMKAIEKTEQGMSDRPTREEITEFWQYELGLTAGLPAPKRKPLTVRTKKESA